MPAIESIIFPPLTNRRNIHIADLAIETVEFLNTFEKNPDVARAFWSRIEEEYTENGQGYSRQEFEELSWHADNAVGILG